MRRLPVLTALALCPALPAACGGDDGGAAGAASSGATTVTATDFAFSETELTEKAGDVALTLKNDGKAPHELVVIKTDAAPDALPVKDGRVPEDGTVGEIEEVEGGATGQHTFKLSPGSYVYVCNLPGHYGKGMRGKLTVE
jgi:uncharacterized cupredoxin-like copper-binding protein